MILQHLIMLAIAILKDEATTTENLLVKMTGRGFVRRTDGVVFGRTGDIYNRISLPVRRIV